MDEVCSSQLLTSVRRMVLTLTQQNDESKEFVKFFHKQLGSILQVRVYFCLLPPYHFVRVLLSFSGIIQLIQESIVIFILDGIVILSLYLVKNCKRPFCIFV